MTKWKPLNLFLLFFFNSHSIRISLSLSVVTYAVLRLDKGAWREKAVARTTPAPNMRRQKEAEKRAIFQ